MCEEVINAEEWRVIVDFPDYSVSNLGRVRRDRPRPRARVGHILSPGRDKRGYARLQLSRDGVPKWRLVHRLVLLAFVGAPPSPTHEGAHWDGDPSHNELANLRWATPLEDAADAKRHGHNRGNPKLTPPKVREIRLALKAGDRRAVIAARFGVVTQTIDKIATGKTWPLIEYSKSNSDSSA